MRILYFSRYTRTGASSRLRSFQYVPIFKEYGHHVKILPFFGDQYINALYGNQLKIHLVVLAYIKRFIQLINVLSFDRVIIEKELFPYFPPLFEWLINKLGVKYIVDYDDAIFHNYDRHPNKFLRKLLGHKIAYVMKYAENVVVCNQYLADYAYLSGAKNVEIIPTVIDIEKYQVKTYTPQEPFVIGWMGTPKTFKYVLEIKPQIEKMIEELPVIFHFVGVQDTGMFKKGVKYIPWSEDTEVLEIQKFDIGIMPLSDSPWEKGKCAYKLIQYMAVGVPVLASNVGLNKEVIQEGVNGYLIKDKEQWFTKVGLLLKHPENLSKMGNIGRENIQNLFTVQGNFEKLKIALKIE